MTMPNMGQPVHHVVRPTAAEGGGLGLGLGTTGGPGAGTGAPATILLSKAASKIVFKSPSLSEMVLTGS